MGSGARPRHSGIGIANPGTNPIEEAFAMRISPLILSSAAALAVAAGCSTTPTAFGGNIAIQSPTDNSAVNAPLDLKIPINFTTNFTLRALGTCDGQNGCGHVYLTIDGSACNKAGQSYNALALSSPTDVSFANCAAPFGQHTVTAGLRDDQGAAVTGTVTGDPVISTITITLQQ
jgi:hypothetical protein